MKFLRTTRLDQSDEQVYVLAAESGELAVPGTFAFADLDPETMSTKEQLAFQGGWLGIGTFGLSTLVQVAEITEQQFDDGVRRLAEHFVDAYGAPDRDAALDAARIEAADAAGLCDHAPGTLLAIERSFAGEGISEKVRVVSPGSDGQHARIWTVVPDDA